MEEEKTTFSDVFTKAKDVYFDNLRTVALFTVFYVCISVLMSVASTYMGSSLAKMMGFDTMSELLVSGFDIQGFVLANMGVLLVYLCVFILLIIISVALNLLLTATLIYFWGKATGKNKVSFNDAFDQVYNKFWIIVGTSLLASIYLLGLFLLLIIPAIIFGVYWVFCMQAVIIRNKSYNEALGYSKKLVQDNWWRYFGYSFLLGLIFVGLTIGVGIVLLPITFIIAMTGNPYIQILLGIPNEILGALMASFGLAFAVVFFKALEKEKRLYISD